jgi:glycosyltransferase involved in cell wall biosynthesis
MGVLMFGGLHEYKGIEYFVRSEPIVRCAVPGVKFLLAGYTSEPDYYRGLMKPGQHMEMRLSRQTEEDVRELFNWADALVLPYVRASQSGVLQLGFSFGVPAVVTNTGGLPDVIRHESNGLVVPVKDHAGLAAAIVRILTDIPLRSRMIEQIKKDRETRFNWHGIASETVRLYEEVLAHRR